MLSCWQPGGPAAAVPRHPIHVGSVAVLQRVMGLLLQPAVWFAACVQLRTYKVWITGCISRTVNGARVSCVLCCAVLL